MPGSRFQFLCLDLKIYSTAGLFQEEKSTPALVKYKHMRRIFSMTGGVMLFVTAILLLHPGHVTSGHKEVMMSSVTHCTLCVIPAPAHMASFYPPQTAGPE